MRLSDLQKVTLSEVDLGAEFRALGFLSIAFALIT